MFHPSRFAPLLRFFLALAVGTSLAAAQGRVVVLGFDGADARTTQAMMDAGELPNLSKLAEQGTFAPLHSTNPAESAAGWAALNTGQNPSKNGVPSFIKRYVRDNSIVPDQAHLEVATKSLDELEPGGLLGILASKSRVTLVGAAAAGLLLLFFVLFGLLLRMNKLVAFLLAVVLSGAGAYGVSTAKGYLPREVPNVYMNKVQVPAMWDHAAEAGSKSLVLDAAMAFGRPAPEGAKVLGGLGLPDIRGTGNGAWFIYTTSPYANDKAPKGASAGGTGTGTEFKVTEHKGRIETQVYGPVDFYQRGLLIERWEKINDRLDNEPDLPWNESAKLREQLTEIDKELEPYGIKGDGSRARKEELHKVRLSVPMVIERDGDEQAKVTIDGQTQTLRVGEWSDYYRLAFRMNPLLTANAVTRARLNSMEDDLVLYVSTLDIDPISAPFWQPVSSPASFSEELADWSGGPYETLGWSCMTNQLKDKALDPTLFVEDIEFTMKWRQRLTMAALGRSDWNLLFSVFSTTDRVQHMMYRFHDPLHPGHDAELAAKSVDFFGEPTTFGDVIPAIYRQMDQRVGEVMAKLEPEDTLILCADHGFTSYRRGMEVNNFLHEAGYLKLRDGVTKRSGSIPVGYVDWSRTQAYSMGLGMVYLNLQGREPNGIVPVDKAREVLERIQADLLAARDSGPDDAPYAEPVRTVQDAEIMWDKYPGESPDAWQSVDYVCADLMIGFAEYYRASWGSVIGKMYLKEVDGAVVAGPTYRNNTNRWSGDHASNSPNLVTGIFFSNRKVEIPENGVSVLHIAPTVLSAMDVAVPSEMDLAPLEFTGQ